MARPAEGGRASREDQERFKKVTRNNAQLGGLRKRGIAISPWMESVSAESIIDPRDDPETIAEKILATQGRRSGKGKKGGKKGKAARSPKPGANQEINRLLAQVERMNKQSELYGKPNKPEGPSNFHRVIDILSRGNYSVMEAWRRVAEDDGDNSFGDQFKDWRQGAWAGFTGKKKTTGSDFLAELGMDKGKGRAIAGFGLDVVTDPLNAVGVGFLTKAPRAARKAKEAADELTRQGNDVVEAAERARSSSTRATDIDISSAVSGAMKDWTPADRAFAESLGWKPPKAAKKAPAKKAQPPLPTPLASAVAETVQAAKRTVSTAPTAPAKAVAPTPIPANLRSHKGGIHPEKLTALPEFSGKARDLYEGRFMELAEQKFGSNFRKISTLANDDPDEFLELSKQAFKDIKPKLNKKQLAVLDNLQKPAAAKAPAAVPVAGDAATGGRTVVESIKNKKGTLIRYSDGSTEQLSGKAAPVAATASRLTADDAATIKRVTSGDEPMQISVLAQKFGVSQDEILEAARTGKPPAAPVANAAEEALQSKAKAQFAAAIAEDGDEVRAVARGGKVQKAYEDTGVTEGVDIDRLVGQTEKVIADQRFRKSDFNVVRQANAYGRARKAAMAAYAAKIGLRTGEQGVRNMLKKGNPGAVAFVNKEAYSTFLEIERRIGTKYPPIALDGTPLRLVDIIDNLGPGVNLTEDHLTQLKGKITDPALQTAVDMARAAGAADEAAIVRNIGDSVTTAVARAGDQAAEVAQSGKAAASGAAKAAGLSPAGRSVAAVQTGRLISQVLDPQLAKQGKASFTDEATTGPLADAQRELSEKSAAIDAYSSEIYRSLGLRIGTRRTALIEIPLVTVKSGAGKAAAKKAKYTGRGANVTTDVGRAEHELQLSKIDNVEGFFRNAFDNAWGTNRALHEMEQTASGGARSVGHEFAVQLSRIIPRIGGVDEFNNAFKHLNDVDADVPRMVTDSATGQQYDLSKTIRDTVDYIQRVASRANLNHAVVNRELDLIFKGGDSGKYRLQEGMSYLDSLKGWDHPRSHHVLPIVMQAVQNAQAKQLIIQNAGNTFGQLASSATGKLLKDKGWKPVQVPGMEHALLKEYVFHPEIAQQLTNMFTKLNAENYRPNKFFQWADEVQGRWKAGVTIYSPGFHIRNMIGDMFLGYLDGVRLSSYRTGAAVIKAGRVRRGQEVESFVAKINDAVPSSGQTLRVAGQDKDYAEIYNLYLEHGMRQDISRAELLGRRDIGEEVATNSAQRVANAVRGLSETREDWGRVSHFVDRLKRYKGDDFDEALREAAEATRKYHLNYHDLTDFEKNVMRRLVPFYTWQRKSIPLLLEQMALKPAAMMVVPKATQAISEMLGYDVTRDDPFPDTDAIAPLWMRSADYFPLGPNAHGEMRYGNIPTPFADMWEGMLGGGGDKPQWETTRNALGAATTPFVRAPIELMRGRQYFGDMPIYDKSSYLSNQVPGLSHLNRFTHQDTAGTIANAVPGGDPMGADRTVLNYGEYPGEGGGIDFNEAALASFLAGVGVTTNSQRKQKGELRRQEDRAQANRSKARAEFLRKKGLKEEQR